MTDATSISDLSGSVPDQHIFKWFPQAIVLLIKGQLRVLLAAWRHLRRSVTVIRRIIFH